MTDPAAHDLKQAVARRGSFVGTLRAVAWSFLGIRRGAGYERDVNELNPVHVVIAGVAAAIAFVLGLIVLVNWIIQSGAAR